MCKKLTMVDVEKLFYYDIHSGTLYWKIRDKSDTYFSSRYNINFIDSFNKKYANTPSGCIQKNKSNSYKYTPIKIEGKFVHVANHKIIWMIHFGHMPNEVDHIDGDGLNNKIDNLRSTTRMENCRNNRKSTRNKSGVCGVRIKIYKTKIVYCAYTFDGIKRKQTSLGGICHFI